MQDKETKLIEKLIDDKEFLTKFSESKSLDKQLEFLKANGFYFSEEEFKSFIKDLEKAYVSNENMSEEELENVSGGKMQMRNKIAAAALVFGALGAGSVMGQASASWWDWMPHNLIISAYNYFTRTPTSTSSSESGESATKVPGNPVETKDTEKLAVQHKQLENLKKESGRIREKLESKRKSVDENLSGQEKESTLERLKKLEEDLNKLDRLMKNEKTIFESKKIIPEEAIDAFEKRLNLIKKGIDSIEVSQQLSTQTNKAAKQKTSGQVKSAVKTASSPMKIAPQKQNSTSKKVEIEVDEFGFPKIPNRPIRKSASGPKSEEALNIEQLQARLEALKEMEPSKQPTFSNQGKRAATVSLKTEQQKGAVTTVQQAIADETDYKAKLEEAKKTKEPVKAVERLLKELNKEKENLQKESLNLAARFEGTGEEVAKKIDAARKPLGQKIRQILGVISEANKWLEEQKRAQSTAKPTGTIVNQTLFKKASTKAKQSSTQTSVGVSQRSSDTAQKQGTTPDINSQLMEAYKAKLEKARKNGTLSTFIQGIEEKKKTLINKRIELNKDKKKNKEELKKLEVKQRAIAQFIQSKDFKEAQEIVKSQQKTASQTAKPTSQIESDEIFAHGLELERLNEQKQILERKIKELEEGSRSNSPNLSDEENAQIKASSASELKEKQAELEKVNEAIRKLSMKLRVEQVSATMAQPADDKAPELTIKLLGLKDERENIAEEIKSLQETYELLKSEDPNSESSKEAKKRIDELEKSLEKINAQIKEIETEQAAQPTKAQTGLPVSEFTQKAAVAPVVETAEPRSGSTNLGNTCYLNTALQVLTHESVKVDGKTFREAILSLTDEQVEGTYVLSALRTFFRAYGQETEEASTSFLGTIYKFFSGYEGASKKVSAETMEQVWQNLAIEGVAAPSEHEQFDTTETLGNIIDRCLVEIDSKIKKINDKIEEIHKKSDQKTDELQNELEKLQELKKTIEQLYAFNYREIDELDVTKNPGDSEATIRQRIDEKIQREHLTQLKDGRYVKPAAKRAVYPSVTLPEAKIDKDLKFNEIFDVKLVSPVSLPKNIIIEFKREHYKQVATGEIQNLKLKNPIEILPEITVHGRPYRLKSISIHSGGATGGHYYAYVRDNVESEKWWCYNDGSVNTTFAAGSRQIENTTNLIRDDFVRKNATNLVYEMVEE